MWDGRQVSEPLSAAGLVVCTGPVSYKGDSPSSFAPAVQWGDISHEEAVESLNLLAGVLRGLRSGTRSATTL
jgi:hypothetical protein